MKSPTQSSISKPRNPYVSRQAFSMLHMGGHGVFFTCLPTYQIAKFIYKVPIHVGSKSVCVQFCGLVWSKHPPMVRKIPGVNSSGTKSDSSLTITLAVPPTFPVTEIHGMGTGSVYS